MKNQLNKFLRQTHGHNRLAFTPNYSYVLLLKWALVIVFYVSRYITQIRVRGMRTECST